MSDPFGAIATQRPGDLGVHIGNGQWASSQMLPNLPVVPQIGAGSQPNPNPSSAITKPTKFSIVEGSPTNPVTSNVTATAMITRYSNMTGGGDANAALWVNHIGTSTTTQPVAIMAQAKGLGDTVAYYGYAENGASSGGAFGIFAFTKATISGGGAIALATEVLNSTGADKAYTTETFVGADLVYGAGGTGKYGSEAVLIRSETVGDRWDAGIWVNGDVIRTATLQDDSSGVNSIVITGDHSDSGISITNNAGHYQQKWIRTSATASTYGLAISPGGVMTIDDITGAKNLLGIFTGTPGANITALSILEGATPTFRRLRTFDPGAAGVNFTAGQLVCVLL